MPQQVGGEITTQAGKPQLSDERSLRSGDFVERIMKEAEARTQRQDAARGRVRKVEGLIAQECKRRQVSITESRSGGRRGRMPDVRAEVARKLAQDYEIAMAEIARQVAVSTSAVSKDLARSYSG
jgi:hypothetical protein